MGKKGAKYNGKIGFKPLKANFFLSLLSLLWLIHLHPTGAFAAEPAKAPRPFYMERMLAWDTTPLEANLEVLRQNAAKFSSNHENVAALGVWKLLRDRAVERYGDNDTRVLCVKIRLGLAYFLARDIQSANILNLSIRREVLADEDLPGEDFELYRLSNTASEDTKQYPGQKIEHSIDFLGQLSRELGETHPTTLSVRENLGQLYENIDRYEDAYLIALENFNLLENSKGPAHPDTLAAKKKLAEMNQKRRAAMHIR